MTRTVNPAMRTLLWGAALSILWLPSALAAESACELRQAPSSLQAISIAPDAAAAEAEVLLYELPQGLTVRPEQGIRIDVRVDQAPYLVETLRILPGQQGDRTVLEMFSGDPGQVAVLRERMEQGAKVEVEIFVGGFSAEVVRFETLLARSTQLLRHPPLPRSVATRLVLASAREKLESLAGALTVCEQQCYDEWDWCYENRCDFGGPPSCLDACDRQLEDCLDACQPPPPSQPTTEIVYVTEPLYYYSLGIDCFYDVFYPWDGWEFDEQVWTFKRTKKQITHNCDGTDTVVILEVTYFNDYCYQRWFWSCGGPFIRYRLNGCWY